VPRLSAILETVLYYDAAAEDDVERFYRDTLGLRRVSRFGDGMVFRVGDGLLLLFDAAKTSARPDERARHGAVGSVHTCFLVPPDEYDRWKETLPVEDEVTWRNGAHSFYFRDPAGNLLEIAERDLWPP
jgi:catechol 2,3-dioxygenase-like lactoylglutathione lyase family enzyme